MDQVLNASDVSAKDRLAISGRVTALEKWQTRTVGLVGGGAFVVGIAATVIYNLVTYLKP